MSELSSATKVPVSSKSAGTSREMAVAVETATGFAACTTSAVFLFEAQPVDQRESSRPWPRRRDVCHG